MAEKSSALENLSLSEFKRGRLDSRCSLCLAGRPKCTVVALGKHSFVAVSPSPALAASSVVICPYSHHNSLLECTDEEVREIRAFAATFSSMHEYVVFSEVVDGSGSHGKLLATPLPSKMSALAPAHVKQALLELDSRLISTFRGPWGYLGPPDALYVHFWLPEGGMAIITSPEPSIDRIVLGGLLRLDPILVRKQPVYSYQEDTDDLDTKWCNVDFTLK